MLKMVHKLKAGYWLLNILIYKETIVLFVINSILLAMIILLIVDVIIWDICMWTPISWWVVLSEVIVACKDAWTWI